MTLIRELNRFIFWKHLGILTAGLVLGIGCAHEQKVERTEPVPVIQERRPISSGKYRSVVLFDLDADGNLDVVAGGAAPTTLSISYGDGNGRISGAQFLPVSGDVQSIAVGDVNNDQLTDIVFSVQQESSGIMVWTQREGRRWEKSAGPTNMNRYQGITTADFNRDGFIDIAAANATAVSDGGVQVWLGDGQGNWRNQTGPTASGIFMDVASADFNADGILDLAAAGWGIDGELRVWFGDGTGNWSTGAPVNEGSYYGIRAADIDADGHLDLLAATFRAGVEVFYGLGNGRFLNPVKLQNWGSFWDVHVLDFERDGTPEVLATSNDGNGIAAWRIIDRRNWKVDRGRFPVTRTYFELAVGDLNQDGFKDVCAASFGEGIKFWHGREDVPYTSITTAVTRPVTTAPTQRVQVVEENDAYTTINGFPEYKIGAGDILEITLWQAASPTREEVLIRPDGKISFGFVEDLYVEGLTPTQLDNRLVAYYREFVKNPRIDVVVKEYKSKYVAMTGSVGGGIRTSGAGTGAGRYPLTGKVRLLEMLARTGGPNRDANLREVRVRRKSGETFALNLYRAIYQGDPSQDIVLNDGDLIFFSTLVLDANRVFVFGEVANPGVIKLAESNMQLFDAIAEAGGPTVFAVKRETKLVRGSVTNPEIIAIDLKKLLEEGDQTQNVALNSGDFIYVPRSVFGDVNVFWSRVKPLFQMIIAPARAINEWDRAYDVLND
jgi:protein involved in polysaccharide export with SLBB domain